jgi:hypothetical protein
MRGKKMILHTGELGNGFWHSNKRKKEMTLHTCGPITSDLKNSRS